MGIKFILILFNDADLIPELHALQCDGKNGNEW
jgi:hypothetical protein